MEKKPFRELTRRQRLVQFRKLAELALHAYGLDEAALDFVQYNENIIYRVETLSDIKSYTIPEYYVPNRFALRIHAWTDVDKINSEMTWLEALAGEGNLPVPAPIPALDGQMVVKLKLPGREDHRCVTMLRWLRGRKLDRGIRPKHLEALGQVMARLHAFSADWQPPEGFTRPRWDWEAQLGGTMFDVSRDVLVESMPEEFRKPFESISQQVKAAMAALGEGSDAFGLIHADLYPENVLFDAGQAHPIDFEDCGYGCWMWDVAVALCTWAWGEDWERMREALYNGYSTIRTISEDQWKLLDLFVAAQYATMLLWASAFLKHDPMRADEYVPWRDESGQSLLKYFDR